MKDYKALSFCYLKMNKKRTVITVAGVSIAVFVLFVMLNLGWSALLHYREKTREENNYELVFFTERSEQIEEMIADPRVKAARVGSYYHNRYDDETGDFVGEVYSNALYVDTSNPYKMLSIMEGLKSDYNVEGDYNGGLAYAYFNDSNANGIFIGVMFLLLVSYIFAIFGVGIIRNSIQLSTMEQIKDYGNMRCIGASKSQLKTFIYIEGAIMELSGMAIGIIVGVIVSMIVGHFLGFAAGFHFLPVLFVAVAFLGDLYFAMQESCKVIVNMTPISAVRGEYRIRKEKIKARKSGIFGKLFGIEGDYAYKNIMRSPGRFVKTIFAIGIGIAALIAGGGAVECIGRSVKTISERYQYYQIYYQVIGDCETLSDEIKAALPSIEQLEALAKEKGITDVKRIYAYTGYMAEDNMVDHFTEQYLETDAGRSTYEWITNFRIEEEEGDDLDRIKNIRRHTAQIECYGYDEQDMERYKNALVEGTVDVSEHGVVLVNGGTGLKYDEGKTMGMEYMYAPYTDYKVGDEIKLIDTKKLRVLVNSRMEVAKKELDDNWDEICREMDNDEIMAKVSNEDRYSVKLYSLKSQIANECYDELFRAGDYVTYTIEGIVGEDVNHLAYEPRLVMPLSNYFAITGTDEGEINGMQYHIEKYPWGKGLSTNINVYEGSGTRFCEESGYMLEMDMLGQAKYAFLGVAVFVLFLISMSSANIINTTASSLHLRRREFAQLRVIGISKKRLVRMVTLEGVITAIVANVVGIAIGGGIGYLLFWYIHMWTGIPYRFPILFVLLGIFLSLLLLAGSIYFPLMGLNQDMAADLAGSGE